MIKQIIKKERKKLLVLSFILSFSLVFIFAFPLITKIYATSITSITNDFTTIGNIDNSTNITVGTTSPGQTKLSLLPNWFNSDWNYRKIITIDNTSNSNNLTDYQVRVNLSSNNFDFNRANSDGSDIRFTDTDGVTLLYHWIEEWNSSMKKATIWVKVPSIPANSVKKIYLYYNNHSIVSTSNGEKTFKFFDDFNEQQQVLAVNESLVTSDGLGVGAHNITSFIGKALWAFNNNQYVIFINNAGHVMIGKRSLSRGNWALYDTGFTVDITNAHESASLGVDSKGYIHIAWGMHAVSLNYARSNNPEDPSAFTRRSMTGQDESRVTYPQFFMANNVLFFSYRDGISSSANQMLNKYDVSTKQWSVIYHPLIDGGGDGAYVDNFAVDGNNRIHISFMFRTSSSPVVNSDYSYAYSDDGGTTWRKSDGTPYAMPITRSDADKFEPGDISGLVNQNHIDVDSNGHPHIVYWKIAPNGHVNYFHAWYNGSSWKIIQLTSYTDTPTSVITGMLARPGILINRANNRVYIFTRHGRDGYIRIFKADPPYISWSSMVLGDKRWGFQEFGGFDYGEWHRTGEMYLMASRVTISSNSTPIYILESDLENTEVASALSSKWVGHYLEGSSGGSVTVANSEVTVSQCSENSNASYQIYSNKLFSPNNVAIRFKGRFPDYTAAKGRNRGGWVGFMESTAFDKNAITRAAYEASSYASNIYITANEGLLASLKATPDPTVNHAYDLGCLSSMSARFSYDNIYEGKITTDVPTIKLPVSIMSRTWKGGYSTRTVVDWILVRKYTSSEPTIVVGDEEGKYNLSGSFTSVNLLKNQDISNIEGFIYKLSILPANTTAAVQFSQDGTYWFSSSGAADGTDTMTAGTDKAIDLSSLHWSGPNFYYKVTFTSDGTATPILDSIALNVTSGGNSSGNQLESNQKKREKEKLITKETIEELKVELNKTKAMIVDLQIQLKNLLKARKEKSPKATIQKRKAQKVILHTVTRGETLWELAQRYLGSRIRWREIKTLEGLPFTGKDTRKLRIGQKVIIPCK